MRSPTLKVILVIAVLLAAAAGAVVHVLSSDTIYPGVRSGGVDLSGLTKTEAAAKLAPEATTLSERKVTLSYAGERFETSFAGIGGKVDVQASAQAAYLVGRQGSILRKLTAILRARKNGVSIPTIYAFDKGTALAFVKKAASRIDRQPVNATLQVDGDTISATPDKPGLKLDTSKSLALLMRAANAGATEVQLSVGTDEPTVKAADLKQIEGLLASYSTRYHPSQRDRSHNLRVACRGVNGTLVKAGEVFSYNKEVGPRLEKFGFREALMFVDGQVEPGMGGGVCQVSTTLYNAALLADMKILRRQHHSRPVVYAPVGRDATVAYPALDLRFRNTSSAPIYIQASVGSNTVDMRIFGAVRDKHDVSLTSAGHQVIGAGVKKVTEGTIVDGKPVVNKPGRSGHRVSTYRVVKDGGGVVRRELISSDYYAPEARLVVTPKSKPEADPLAAEGQ